MATTTQIVSLELSRIMFMWFPPYAFFLSGNCQLNHVSMYEMLEDAIQIMYITNILKTNSDYTFRSMKV